MNKGENLKKIVQEKYSVIVDRTKEENQNCCCGSTPGAGHDYTVFSEDYKNQAGYLPDADLGLGCGIPTEHANISAGDHVLDLGSGAGNDVFVARSIVGEKGHVTGLDFTDKMIDKAKANAEKLNYTNTEFVKGDIEDMPLEDNRFDVVISNCVLNLVPNKEKTFTEIARVLKPGGHMCVSDIVLVGELPDKLKEEAAMYAGCVSGASQKDEYIGLAKKAGFKNLEVKKEKPINLPDSILENYLDKNELADFRNQDIGIFSITLYGDK